MRMHQGAVVAALPEPPALAPSPLAPARPVDLAVLFCFGLLPSGAPRALAGHLAARLGVRRATHAAKARPARPTRTTNAGGLSMYEREQMKCPPQRRLASRLSHLPPTAPRSRPASPNATAPAAVGSNQLLRRVRVTRRAAAILLLCPRFKLGFQGRRPGGWLRRMGRGICAYSGGPFPIAHDPCSSPSFSLSLSLSPKSATGIFKKNV